MTQPTDDLRERVKRAIWLAQTTEGWDDGSSIEKRMSNASGLLVSPDYFSDAADAAIALCFAEAAAMCEAKLEGGAADQFEKGWDASARDSARQFRARSTTPPR